jgi:aspartokinase-like uncharacterized kinase
MIVVKVGGSLFDHPRLRSGLRAYLESLAPDELMLVPGGGDFADAVRKLDRIHGLSEEVSHALALRAMTVSAEFLARLLDIPTIGSQIHIPNAYEFAAQDLSNPGALPASWNVTSDSIAARMAVVLGAKRLILLKSVDIPPGLSWQEAAKRGSVDSYFPNVIRGAAFKVEAVNFRSYLDSLLP